MFSSPISDKMTKDEREKVLNDILYNVKKNSIDYRSSQITDISLLQQIVKEQNELSKIHITLS